MATVSNKQNLTISIREYTDNQGQTKKVWKTIGELVTWDDGKQSFELWGPTGSTRGSVFDQDNNQGGQPAQQGYQQPQGNVSQAMQRPAQQQRPAPQQAPNGFGQPTGQPAPAPSGFDDFNDDIPFNQAPR